MKPHISAVILTEAGPDIGYGHLGRCVALADALRVLGGQPRLAVRGQAPADLVGDHELGEVDWNDARSVDDASAGLDAVVLDSYTAPLEVYERVAQMAPVCVWFDDGVRLAYPPGVIVNGAPHAAQIAYQEGKGTLLLLGPAYQALRHPFWDTPRREARPRLTRVLLVFGGTDVRGLTAAVAEALQEAYPDIAVDAVTVPRTAEEMRGAMLASDVAISAAGQTLSELAATGTPTIAVCVASNQEQQARAFAEAGTIELAGSWDEPDIVNKLVASIDMLGAAEDRQRMSDAGRTLVDGRGALRVAKRVIARALDARIELRPGAAEDERALLDLANDPGVRAASFGSDPISPREHQGWFRERLADPDTLLLLAWDAQALAGYVRFEVAGDEAEVSIALAEHYRGKGLALPLLVKGVGILREEQPHVRDVVAGVRTGNEASVRLFEHAGFEKREVVSAGSERISFIRSL